MNTATTAPTVPPKRRIIRLREVRNRVGYKTSNIYRLISLGEFPKPTKFCSYSVGWYEDEIAAWVNARTQREQGTSDNRIIRMSEVEELTGFKRSYIYGLIRKNKFPQSIAIGARIVGWDANSVLEWIEAQKVSE